MSSRSSKKTTEARGAGPGPRPPQAPETPATPGPPGTTEAPPDTVLVGRVLRPHGVRGEIAVLVLSDVPDRVAPGRTLLVTDGEGRPPADPRKPRTLTVAAVRPTARGTLVRFVGVDDRDGSETLRGLWLSVDRAAVPPAPAGTYYHFELLGCRCRADGEDVGTVVDLEEDGGGLLLILEKGGWRLPVPFVQKFLREVDIAGRRIELTLPAGLIETCASTS
jgi:16S rRNA processing protein RimM